MNLYYPRRALLDRLCAQHARSCHLRQFLPDPQNPLQPIQETSYHDYAGHFLTYKSSDPDKTHSPLINRARSSDNLAAVAKLPSPFKNILTILGFPQQGIPSSTNLVIHFPTILPNGGDVIASSPNFAWPTIRRFLDSLYFCYFNISVLPSSIHVQEKMDPGPI
jgi:hypothetical protein